jgi:uncharacterized protein (DUF1778 family)
MKSSARFDLKFVKDEKKLFSEAAALMGTTMAGFVRTAAEEKARALLDQERRLTLSAREREACLLAIRTRLLCQCEDEYRGSARRQPKGPGGIPRGDRDELFAIDNIGGDSPGYRSASVKPINDVAAITIEN